MKKRVWFVPLIGFTLMAIPLVGSYQGPYAEDLSRLVKCKGEVCEISKADWNRLQAFHNRMIEWAERNQKADEEAANAINGLNGALERCKAEKPQRIL